MSDWQVIAVLFAITTIVVLTSIAGYYHWRLHQVAKIHRKAIEAEREQAQRIRQEHVHSIKFIARAFIEGQVGTAEASLRVSKLFDLIELEASIREDFCTFDHVAKKIAHIPILEQWTALPKAKKREYEKYMGSIEQDLADLVKDTAVRIQTAVL